MTPFISVVVPVYNAAPYLRRCLDSIVNQTLREIEIICVDDGSTDDSLSILREYQAQDDRIILLVQKNQFAGVARNNGMQFARGKYIIFWDADDFFDLKALEELYGRAEKTAADIVICDSDAWDDKRGERMNLQASLRKEYLPKAEVFSMKDIPDTIFQIFVGWPWDKLFRLEFIHDKNLSFHSIRTAEDIKFVLPALAVSDRISVLQKKLVVHRRFVESSLESTRNLNWNSTFEAFDNLFEELCQRKVICQVRRSFDCFVAEHGIHTVTDLHDFKAYCNFYEKFKTETITKYKLLEHDPSYYLVKGVYEKLLCWQKLSAEEYLLSENKKNQDELTRMCSYCKKASESCDKKSWLFPEHILPTGCNLVLYGAGDVGQDFYKQFQREKLYHIVSWVDGNAEKYQRDGGLVEDTDTVKSVKYDYILIAVVKRDIAEEIKADLLGQGISQEKIVWVDLLGS